MSMIEVVPAEVLVQIASYLVDDRPSIVAFVCASSPLVRAVFCDEQQVNDLWQTACKEIWRCRYCQDDDIAALHEASWRHQFFANCRTDAAIWEHLRGPCTNGLLRRTLADVARTGHWDRSGNDDVAHSTGSTETFMRTGLLQVDGVPFIVDQGRAALDCLGRQRKRIYETPPSDVQHPSDFTIQKILINQIMVSLNTVHCIHVWKSLMERVDSDFPVSRVVSSDGRVYSHQLIEEAAILVSRLAQTVDEISEGFHVPSDTSRILGSIAAQCRALIPDGASVKKKLEVVNSVLFERFGFQGNARDYYNYQNSSIDWVLRSKQGIPITLCIIYCCVCGRLGIEAYLMGLPGHVVLGVSDPTSGEPIYVDVYRGGTFLAFRDLQVICHSYGFPWMPDFALPESPWRIYLRLLNNIENCAYRGMRQQSTSPMHLERMQYQVETMKICQSLFIEIGTRRSLPVSRFLDAVRERLVGIHMTEHVDFVDQN